MGKGRVERGGDAWRRGKKEKRRSAGTGAEANRRLEKLLLVRCSQTSAHSNRLISTAALPELRGPLVGDREWRTAFHASNIGESFHASNIGEWRTERILHRKFSFLCKSTLITISLR
jgi:hypothetical protein